MSRSRKTANRNTMLELWRPPQHAGDPVGCLATTYTFSPRLFDEQCLARFLGIEAEPNWEDLAYLIERESRLGAAYAGVLVDHTKAGVEHSLRWDVLPVRITGAKQHAKISLLVWSQHIRIIVASANLTDLGYRTNFEVAGTIECTPDDANKEIFSQTVSFLQSLLQMIPGAADRPPEWTRATQFLNRAKQQMASWKETSRRGQSFQQSLVFTLPSFRGGRPASSALDAAVVACQVRNNAPDIVHVASPFFDAENDDNEAARALCTVMSLKWRTVVFCVPGDLQAKKARLYAPKSLWLTAQEHSDDVSIEVLPEVEDGNARPWHAKMFRFESHQRRGLMIGSSNFTCAGLGLKNRCNAEANLITVIDQKPQSREPGSLRAVWPETQVMIDPDSAEWLGVAPDEEERAPSQSLPLGFLGATFRAGETRSILLRLAPRHLPETWQVYVSGISGEELLVSSKNLEGECPPLLNLDWAPVQPPERLLVRWVDGEQTLEAFLPLNVDDYRLLPPPPRLEDMTADEMLQILAAENPGSAIRSWARQKQPAMTEDAELDWAIPADLDPLHRYDLQATYLHRIRKRARILARLRERLERPVWGRQALEARLRGIFGIEALADRLLREFLKAEDDGGESLLILADLLIVLQEVDYQPRTGYMSKIMFNKIYRQFLKDLAKRLDKATARRRKRLPKDLLNFWQRVVARCGT